MSETSLKFGPQWLRALAQGNSTALSQVPEAPPPKYKLADFRYGREEMLALFSKDLKIPEQLKEYDFLIAENPQMPLALLPVTEDEQRIWARSVNSDVALRGSGKSSVPSGNGMSRSRGGMVDRGRGRGRGGFYHRGISFEENDDGQPGSFPWNRSLERSQSTSEKDQRWEERDRRFDRQGYSVVRAGGGLDDATSHVKQDSSRAPNDSWRKPSEKDDESDWRTTNSKVDKFAGRGSWRSHGDRDRNRHDSEGKDKGQLGRDQVLNGPNKSISSHPRQRLSSGHNWDDTILGDNLPEWSVEEPAAVTDVVGTFDSSGAFLETKVYNTSVNSDVYVSDEDENEKRNRPSPERSPPGRAKVKNESPPANNAEPTIAAPVVKNVEQDMAKKETVLSPVHNFPVVEKKNKHVPQIVPMEQQSKLHHAVVTQRPKPPNELRKETPPVLPEVPASVEEDAFAHHKKATESMVAQWTEEEEQKVIPKVVEKVSALPLHDENAQKWYYRDPQGLVQGPFNSTEMCEWFNLGYFTMDLMVRRGCDERFTQLGELLQSWGRIPFVSGQNPPPLLAPTVSTHTTPITESAPQIQTHTQAVPQQPVSAQIPQSDAQLRLMQQQMLHQLVQQELLFRQAQVLNHLKQQETFASLNPQQQNQLVQQLLSQQQQLTRPPSSVIEQSSHESAVPPLPFPLMGLAPHAPAPSLLKHDISLSWRPPHNPAWALSQPSASLQPTGSIWDTDTSTVKAIEVSELEKKLAAEEDEKRRLAIDAVKRLEEEKKRLEEEKRKDEELKRKQDEERLMKELQKQEEEKRRLAEEEKRRLEELCLKEEEIRRKQEEMRILEEKLQAERKEQKLREQLQREEMKRLEELKIQEERKRQEELLQKQLKEQERQMEMQRLKELERLKELQRLKEQEKQMEIQRMKEQQDRQMELQRMKEQERQMELQRKEQQEREMELQRMKEEREIQREIEMQREMLKKKEAEMARFAESKGPVWGMPTAEKKNDDLSLSDIQVLQEKKEREEQKLRIKILQQQQQQQLQFLQQEHQQSLKQAQANKNGLSWAKRSAEPCGVVKSLDDIQQEEAEKMASQQKVVKTAATTVQAMAATGVWGTSSQINRISSNQGWGNSNSCFWDDAVKSTAAPKQTNDSAFPALANSLKPANVGSNKNKNIRAKKDEDAVLKIFETHRKPTDEFTSWCMEALSNLNSSVDVPTFIAFLKDVESPYEVHDYVRSYLGEGKEAKDFGKQFLERRSKYRNQAKQIPGEENMWGPAPALTPSVNKPINQTVNDCDSTLCNKGKAKKKKNRMQKLDNSMLGFTVQPNPDRLNVGEIDHVEGM